MMVNDTFYLNKQEHNSGDKKGSERKFPLFFMGLFWLVFAALVYPA